MELFIIFLTGLTTGGLSCLAVQGGLLASIVANQKDLEHDEIVGSKSKKKAKNKKKYLQKLKGNSFSFSSFDQLDWLPVVMFLSTKVIAHTILGALLGMLGSALTLSLGVKLAFQIFTALFMFATAMNLLDVHPIFRYVVLQPPKFLQKYIRSTSKGSALFTPAVLGFLTVFIPCGVTQAMEVTAINSASPVYGALIMFAFTLGTVPLFALIGIATAKLSEGWYASFTKWAAYALIAMAVYSANGVAVVLDYPSITGVASAVRYQFSQERVDAILAAQGGFVGDVQKVVVGVSNFGYTPDYVRVYKDTPVELTLTSQEAYSCATAFVFREFGINTFLKPTDSQAFVFTPTKTGRFTYTCSMGMYSGVMEVI